MPMIRLSRRTLLQGSAATAFLTLARPGRAAATAVHEVTVAAPDVICVELRDPPFRPGRLLKAPAALGAPHGTWVTLDGEWARVISRSGEYARTQDRPPDQFLDRQRIDDASGYAPLGDRTVQAVYRKSVPYDSGTYRGGEGETIRGSSFKHYVYLHLSAALPPGAHTIRWPDGFIADTEFRNDDRSVRAISIRTTQHGHRPNDTAKLGFLALWLPGGPDSGAVDFRRYGIDSFHVIDAAGDIAFTAPIRLRTAPHQPEPGSGFPDGLIAYPKSGAHRAAVSAVAATNPVRITAPGHGFSDGEQVWIGELSGMSHGSSLAGTVAEATFEGFVLAGIDGSSFPPYQGGAIVTAAQSANRAGTYVFELDYSAWRPSRGEYRVHIPGLGVSDPFTIDEAAWLAAARKSVEGLYHHRSGIALDGRFGYVRPASFRPDDTFTVLESRLPFAWSSESETGFVPFQKAAESPWITARQAPRDFWGGYMDAGDWDRRIQHLDIGYLLLDVFEQSPDTVRRASLGIPKSGEVLDPALYGNADHLPDLIHEAIWGIDFYRRLQASDGSIIGGIESADTPNGSGEPSFLEHRLVFAYAPDHLSTYRYVKAAAKLAKVLADLNEPQLAAVYRASAVAAWQAAEAAHRAPDSYYASAIELAADEFRTVPWEVRRSDLQKQASEFRTAAAAALYRLTGRTELAAIFEQAWTAGLDLYAHSADGAWEYANADHPGVAREVQAAVRTAFTEKTAEAIVKAQRDVAYPSTKYFGLAMLYGQGSAPDYNQVQLLIRTHKISGDDVYLAIMQRASAHILGANQVGLSFTLGLGHRNVRHPLHEDHIAMGVKAPDGITIYGWAPQDATAYGFVFGDYYTPLPERGWKEHAAQRRVEPLRYAMPLYEYLIEHPLVIMQQEYTVHQTIGTTAGLWLYMHGQSA